MLGNEKSLKERFANEFKNTDKEAARASERLEESDYQLQESILKFGEHTTVESFKLYIERDERFVYYLIGLSVALVSYSVHTSRQSPYKWEEILLGSAILFWTFAICFGLYFIVHGTRFIDFNIRQVHAESNKLGRIGSDQRRMDKYSKTLDSKMRETMRDQKMCFNRLVCSFLGGIVFFILWVLLEKFHL